MHSFYGAFEAELPYRGESTVLSAAASWEVMIGFAGSHANPQAGERAAFQGDRVYVAVHGTADRSVMVSGGSYPVCDVDLDWWIEEAGAHWVPDVSEFSGGPGRGWLGFAEDSLVEGFCFTSGTSGAEVHFERKGNEVWKLAYRGPSERHGESWYLASILDAVDASKIEVESVSSSAAPMLARHGVVFEMRGMPLVGFEVFLPLRPWWATQGRRLIKRRGKEVYQEASLQRPETPEAHDLRQPLVGMAEWYRKVYPSMFHMDEFGQTREVNDDWLREQLATYEQHMAWTA